MLTLPYLLNGPVPGISDYAYGDRGRMRLTENGNFSVINNKWFILGKFSIPLGEGWGEGWGYVVYDYFGRGEIGR